MGFLVCFPCCGGFFWCFSLAGSVFLVWFGLFFYLNLSRGKTVHYPALSCRLASLDLLVGGSKGTCSVVKFSS